MDLARYTDFYTVKGITRYEEQNIKKKMKWVSNRLSLKICMTYFMNTPLPRLTFSPTKKNYVILK